MSAAEVELSPRPSRFGRFFWRDPNTQFLLLSVAAGLVGGFGAILFRWLTHRLTGLFTVAPSCGWTKNTLGPLWRHAAPTRTAASAAAAIPNL